MQNLVEGFAILFFYVYLSSKNHRMAKTKTQATESSVHDFIQSLPDEAKQKDSLQLIALFKQQSGFQPKMWGASIIGFGSYHYKYASGHEGDAPIIAFSPRKAAFSLYLSLPADKREKLLQQFGKHKAAKGCIYFKKMDDINENVLKEMISISLQQHN
jgi:single-stranded DNA-specific DHH superfamily exonuclease